MGHVYLLELSPVSNTTPLLATGIAVGAELITVMDRLWTQGLEYGAATLSCQTSVAPDVWQAEQGLGRDDCAAHSRAPTSTRREDPSEKLSTMVRAAPHGLVDAATSL